MNNKLISVLMPAYNAEKYIFEAINSIINQTYNNWELIIVDDASTDRTNEIINSFTDPRIKVFKNSQNMGIAFSTNRCIKESSGEYFALMDDDDIAISYRFEKTLAFLENNPQIDIVGGAAIAIGEDGSCFKNMEPPRLNPKMIKAYLLFKDCMLNGTVLMRRSVVYDNNIWYKDACFGMQDYMFFVEASKKVEMANLPEVVLKYRYHSNRETSKNKTNQKHEREKKYAEIQRESLILDGYILEESEFDIINECVAEQMKMEYSINELKELSTIFEKIIMQAKKNGKIEIDELIWCCKKIIGDRLTRTKLFEFEK